MPRIAHCNAVLLTLSLTEAHALNLACLTLHTRFHFVRPHMQKHPHGPLTFVGIPYTMYMRYPGYMNASTPAAVIVSATNTHCVYVTYSTVLLLR
jgi:hypothetical protein